MYALDDVPYPSKSSPEYPRPRAFGIGLDAISCSNPPSIASVAPSSSGASLHTKSPCLRASGIPTYTSNKENVSPVTESADMYPVEVQQLFIPPLPISCTPALGSIISPGLPPIQTILDMTLCGQSITFDLEGLAVDPHSIIELLRSTSSDRDKWMVVGASYKRKGNTHAALTVIARFATMVKG